jgi:hypothetical protein
MPAFRLYIHGFGQILNMEQSEISVIKSRGAEKGSLFRFTLIQSSLIAAVCLAPGCRYPCLYARY